MMICEIKNKVIKDAIEKLLGNGKTNISEIYTIICNRYGLPRTTVRRIKKELLHEMILKVHILEDSRGRKPIPRSIPSNIDNLDIIEQRILEFLQNTGAVHRYVTIYNSLNFNTNYTHISKQKLTHYLGKLCAANLIKKLQESRYRIMEKKNVS